MSTLVAHNPKFNSKLVTREALALLPPAPRLGRWHAPVPHHELVATIEATSKSLGLQVIREKFALGNEGGAIFGIIDFDGGNNDRAVSLGFRNSTDQTVALQGVAGSHVFVCDNLALSGDFEAWSHKNTTGLNLLQLVRQGFDLFAQQSANFERSIKRLESTEVNGTVAAACMWDVFAKGALPARYIEEAHTNYFAPTPEMTDCHPRTMWGVHNALTRCARNLSPTRLLEATTGLGKIFNIGEP